MLKQLKMIQLGVCALRNAHDAAVVGSFNVQRYRLPGRLLWRRPSHVLVFSSLLFSEFVMIYETSTVEGSNLTHSVQLRDVRFYRKRDA